MIMSEALWGSLLPSGGQCTLDGCIMTPWLDTALPAWATTTGATDHTTPHTDLM